MRRRPPSVGGNSTGGQVKGIPLCLRGAAVPWAA